MTPSPSITCPPSLQLPAQNRVDSSAEAGGPSSLLPLSGFPVQVRTRLCVCVSVRFSLVHVGRFRLLLAPLHTELTAPPAAFHQQVAVQTRDLSTVETRLRVETPPNLSCL